MASLPAVDSIAEDQNRWWSDPKHRQSFIFNKVRDLFNGVWRYLGEDRGNRAAVLIGPRQVGKTTLLLQVADRLLDEGWPPGNLTYFDFSDDRLAQPISPRSLADLRPPGLHAGWPRIFLLDEIQEAVNWERWLKASVDAARRVGKETRPVFIATGSSAGALREGGVESGQGRWDEIPVEGLSYAEFLRFGAREGESVDDVRGREPGAFRRYLSVGGFPEHARVEGSPSPYSRIRQDIVERAILRDLRRTGVDLDRVRRLFLYLVTGSGDIWNAEARAADLGNSNPKSVREWLFLLEHTHLVWRLERELSERPKARTKLRAQPKIYAADHGLITALSPWADPLDDPETRGRVLEAAVFRHLRDIVRATGGSVGYFRRDDNLEMDFVFRPPRGMGVAIEVTGSPDVDGRKLERFVRASEIAGAGRTIVVHNGLGHRTERDVEMVPAREFLLSPNRYIEGPS